MQSSFQFCVEENFVGERLDVVVFKCLDSIPSRSVATKLINAGHVTLNNKRERGSARVKLNDCINIETEVLEARALTQPSPESISLEIIFEDEDILVINKAAGMVVHPGAGVSSGTLVNAVLAHCGATLPSLGGPVRAGIVHRLDRDTSGVMVIAKTQLALTELSKQFADHTQERIYLALVYNRPEPPDGVIETTHGRDPHNRIRYAVVDSEKGKYAKLTYFTLGSYVDGLVSLVQCQLYTGRTHQIRVQMQSIRCPLLGDDLYGRPPQKILNKKKEWAILNPLLVRQMLHAKSLSFTHPRSNLRLTFESQLPLDFSTVVSALSELK